jgi:NADH:ubiquinone oxidoreductase subunit 2 (subunit N)
LTLGQTDCSSRRSGVSPPFAGLRARAPLLAARTPVFLLSLAGLPPLVGFSGQFYPAILTSLRGMENDE